MSQGFHPKPRVSYLSALPLGFSSDDEAMEIILEEDWTPEDLLARLNAATVEGLDFLSAVALDDKEPKQQAESFSYEATIPPELASGLDERIEEFLRSPSVEVVKANGKTLDARPCALELTFDGTTLRFTLAAQTGPEVGAREILDCLGLGDRLFREIFPNRTRSTIRS